MRNRRATSQRTLLPPIIPDNLEQLDRVIMLLGSRTKNELKPKVERELRTLIRAYPSAEQAAEWKRELRRIRKERLIQKTESQVQPGA